MISINKNFSEVSGVNSDNILVLDLVKGRKISQSFITFPKTMNKSEWLSTFYIKIYTARVVNNESIEQLLIDFEPYSLYYNIQDGVNLEGVLSYDFYTTLLGTSNFNGVNFTTGNDGNSVEFFPDKYYRIEIGCSDSSILNGFTLSSSQISISDNTLTAILSDYDSASLSSIDLLITSTDFHTVLSKTFYPGVDGSMKFNTYSLFSGLDNFAPLKVNIKVIEKTVVGSVTTEFKDLGEFVFLPDNPNNPDNTDYKDFYTFNNRKFLTYIPQITSTYGSVFATSILTYDLDDSSDLRLLVKMKDVNGNMVDSDNISVSSPTVLTWFENNNGRLDIYYTMPEDETIRTVEFELMNGSKSLSESLKVDLKVNCNNYANIFFINKIGGLDSFSQFASYNSTKALKSRKSYYGENKGDKKSALVLSESTTEYVTDLLGSVDRDRVFDMCQSYNTFKLNGKERHNVVISKFSSSLSTKEGLKQLKLTIDE